MTHRFTFLLPTVINRGLPNIVTFVKVVLKREKLSEEAESYRARYEAILKAMEEGQPLPRPVSLIGDDDSGYHSTKPKGMNLCVHVCLCVVSSD